MGAVGALAYMQASGTQLPFGIIPSESDAGSAQLILSGAGNAFCFGIFGILLAAGAGAGEVILEQLGKLPLNPFNKR